MIEGEQDEQFSMFTSGAHCLSLHPFTFMSTLAFTVAVHSTFTWIRQGHNCDFMLHSLEMGIPACTSRLLVTETCNC